MVDVASLYGSEGSRRRVMMKQASDVGMMGSKMKKLCAMMVGLLRGTLARQVEARRLVVGHEVTTPRLKRMNCRCSDAGATVRACALQDVMVAMTARSEGRYNLKGNGVRLPTSTPRDGKETKDHRERTSLRAPKDDQESNSQEPCPCHRPAHSFENPMTVPMIHGHHPMNHRQGETPFDGTICIRSRHLSITKWGAHPASGRGGGELPMTQLVAVLAQVRPVSFEANPLVQVRSSVPGSGSFSFCVF